eukprot:1954307-Pyramimonas_sp.AAC.1
MTTAARFAAVVTYTRIVVSRSASSIARRCSDRTTFDISAAKQGSTQCPFSSESSPLLQSSTMEHNGT